MIDTTFLDHLKKFSLIVNKRVTSVYSGQKLSTSTGRGITFKDHRIYAPGDDFRSIDWKVYARTDDLYIKNYEEEKNLNVHILIDFSGSMNFGKPFTKFEYASMIGVGFAYLAMKDNEKFQFATFSENIDVFKPKKGMNHLASMVEHLNNIKIDGESRFLESIMHYKRFIGSRSLIIIVSDFLVDVEEIKKVLYILGNHDIKFVQVLGREEKDLMMEGDFKLKDSETKTELKTYIGPRLRHKYLNLLNNHVNQIHETCNSLNIGFYQVTTDTPIFDTFYNILKS